MDMLLPTATSACDCMVSGEIPRGEEYMQYKLLLMDLELVNRSIRPGLGFIR